jgi:hypothetical protein
MKYVLPYMKDADFIYDNGNVAIDDFPRLKKEIDKRLLKAQAA